MRASFNIPKQDDAKKIQGKPVDEGVGNPSDGDILVYRDAGDDWTLETKPSGGGGGSSSWGNISGNISNQTDLQAALDAKAASSHTHATTDITSGTMADARIAESNVTQHQAALSVTESQISDLGSYITATLTNEEVQDIVGGMVTGNTESGITVAYQDSDGTIDFTVDSQTDENFTSALKTKLDGIETSADVTDTANVTAAGALMDSEVDADLKTLTLPANTTISTFGASLVDDASAIAARTTLGVDAAGTDNAPSASTSVAGKVELATTAETDTGTATDRAVTPDGLAGSNYGERTISVLINDATALTSGDGKAYARIPSSMNGFNLVEVAASRLSGTGTPSFQIHNLTQTQDMLSTNITIDSGETDSSTAATAAVINTSNDDVATGDRLRIDCDDAGTDTLWAEVQLIFRLP